MNKRYIGAFFMLPLVVFLVLGGVVLKYGLMVLSLIGMYEFFKVIKTKQFNPLSYLAYAITLIYYLTLGKEINLNILTSLIIIGTFLMLCMPVINVKFSFVDVALSIFAFIYIAVFFSFISAISYKGFGNYLLWLVFIASFSCDTAAYYVGKNFGKYKFIPKVSPNKTLEGSIGGMLGSMIACGIFGSFMIMQGFSGNLFHFYVIGAICGVFSQFGDLVASSIKRFIGVKDYSNLIPGHGGILDRFDSILFSSVVVYYYLSFIMGI